MAKKTRILFSKALLLLIALLVPAILIFGFLQTVDAQGADVIVQGRIWLHKSEPKQCRPEYNPTQFCNDPDEPMVQGTAETCNNVDPAVDVTVTLKYGSVVRTQRLGEGGLCSLHGRPDGKPSAYYRFENVPRGEITIGISVPAGSGYTAGTPDQTRPVPGFPQFAGEPENEENIWFVIEGGGPSGGTTGSGTTGSTSGGSSPPPPTPANCADNSSFFGVTTWHKYLEKVEDKNSKGHPTGTCTVVINSIEDITLIMLAIIEIVFRLAVLLSVAYMIFAAYLFVMGRGDMGGGSSPGKIGRARQALTYAIIGLVVSMLATILVGFLAETIK